MAQFTVRNLEDDIHRKLREMAECKGQNLEEFVRELLRRAALESSAAPNALGTKIARRFTEIGLIEPIEELRGRSVTPPGFE